MEEKTVNTDPVHAPITTDNFKERLTVGDPVLAPLWYRGDGEIDCKRAIASMMAEAPLSPKQGYWWGNAFKYLWRWWAKNKEEDLNKCIECIQNLKLTL